MAKGKKSINIENDEKKEVPKSEFEMLYQESTATFNEGEIVKGKIVDITSKEDRKSVV